MRYIKVLLLAIFFFVAMVFFLQNQAPLSQQMQLTLNLFFLPPVTTMPLPFYYILIAAFFLGILLTVCWLLWDKITISTKYMRSKWKVSSLQGQVSKLKDQLEEANATIAASKAKALPAASTSEEITTEATSEEIAK